MKKRSWVLVVVLCVICCSAYAGKVDLGPIVVTPSRVAEPASQAASNVSVITRQDIERSGAVCIPDVLEREAGVNVYSQGSPKSKIVDIRGIGDTTVRNVLVLVNGRRINPVDSSGPDWLQVPMESIEKIEIIRGAASVAYGDNANAGVVNIITKDGEDKAPYARASGELGSYGLKRSSLETGGEQGRVSYYLSSGYSDMDGYRVNSGLQARDVQARTGYRFNDQARLDIEAGWHMDDYRLPGGMWASWIAANGRRSSDTPDDYANSKDRFVRIATELKPGEADGSLGILSLDYSHRDRDTFGFLNYGGGYTSQTQRNSLTDAAGIKYVLTPQLFERDLRLTGGVDLSDTGNTIRNNSGVDLVIRKKDEGVYLLSDYALTEKLSVNGGVRRQRVDYIFDQRDTPNYVTRSPRVTASSGGVKYAYAPGSNVFASAAQTFRFLATDELYSEWTGLNTSLRHQEGVEYQAGVVHQLSALRLDATGFDIRNKDEIFVDPTLSGGVGDNSNYGRIERRGLELGADLDLHQGFEIAMFKAWNIFVNTTLQTAQFAGGSFDGKDVPFVPRYQFKAGTGIAFKNGFGFDVTGRWTGAKAPINDTLNTRPKVKPTFVVDTRVRFAWKSSEIYAGVNNVFNEKYNDYVAYGQSSGNTDYYPAPERNFLAGMKHAF